MMSGMTIIYGWFCVYVISSYRNSIIFQDDDVDQSKETERPGAIVSNHVSYVDILYHMSASFPSFVAKVL
jgi:1-acyl-sn-glycerol-3-phosphate acyltransferase